MKVNQQTKKWPKIKLKTNIIISNANEEDLKEQATADDYEDCDNECKKKGKFAESSHPNRAG